MPYPRKGRHPGVDRYFVPTRGNQMSMANKQTDEGNLKTEQAMDKELDTGGQIEFEKVKEFLYGVTSKRKFRVNVDAEKAHSAPTSPNVSTLDLTWDEEEARSVKRVKGIMKERGSEEALLRTGSEGESGNKYQQGAAGLATAIRRIIKRLDEESRSILMYSKERNTKREIKESANKIRSLASQLATEEAKTLLQTLGSKMAMGRSGEDETGHQELKKRIEKLEEENERLKKKVDDLTRASQIAGLSKESRARGTKDKNSIESAIVKGGNYEEFSKIKGLSWPKDIYKTVFIVQGSPLRANKDADLVMVEEDGSGGGENEGLRKAIAERYPEIENIGKRVGAITVTTRAVNREGKITESERWVIKGEAEGGLKETFRLLEEIKEMAVKGGRKKLALYPSNSDPSGERTRKMLEYIFRKSGVKCLLYISGKQKEGRKEMEVARRQKKKERGTEALIFQQEGKTYAELLKTFKEKVKPDTEAAKVIRTIRESRDGKMVVVIDSGRSEETNELQREIRKMEVKVMRRREGNEETLIVKEIDALTTREEVVEALIKTTGEDRSNMYVGEMRKAFAGNQAVTIRISREKARELVKRGHIRIGLSMCSVRERVEVVRCFRCWKYGHIGKECKEERDNSKLCRKCGGAEHLEKSCRKEEFCLTCKERGHTVGSGKCPEFRKALARERRVRSKKRAY